jgi:hypothetical protein
VQGLPQWPELLAAGSVEGPEQRGPSSHGQLGGSGGGKVGSVAISWAGACQAKAAVAEGKGVLVGEGPVCAGVGRDGEIAVYRFVLGTLHSGADVLPPASPGQVRHPLLEAPLENQPPVLVSQAQCQEIFHEVLGVSGAAVRVGCLERRVADSGAGGKETVGCVAHAQVAGDRGGGGAIRGVDVALCQLRVEAEGSCKGGEGLHGRCWVTLQEGIVCVGQRLCQVHCCDLL